MEKKYLNLREKEKENKHNENKMLMNKINIDDIANKNVHGK